MAVFFRTDTEYIKIRINDSLSHFEPSDSKFSQKLFKLVWQYFATEVHNIAQNENCQYGPNISPSASRKQAHI